MSVALMAMLAIFTSVMAAILALPALWRADKMAALVVLMVCVNYTLDSLIDLARAL